MLKRSITKSIAVVLSFLLILADVALLPKNALAEENHPKHAPINKTFNLSLTQGEVASSFVSAAPNSPRLILIEDAHNSLDAQESIHSILSELKQHYPKSKIYVEGSSGKISWDVFWDFPNEESKKLIARYYLTQGRMSGAEVFAALQKEEKLFGLEDKATYLENADAYRAYSQRMDPGEKGLTQITQALSAIQGGHITSELRQWQRELQLRNNDSANLFRYLEFLSRWAKNKQVSLKDYPVIQKLVTETGPSAFQDIEALEFFREQEELEWNLLQSIEISPSIKRSILFQRNLNLLRKLFFLELSPSEWEYVKELDVAESLKDMKEFIIPFSGRLNLNLQNFSDFQLGLEAAKLFYEKATEREKYIFSNLLQQMRLKDVQTHIVVLGGFHSQALQNFARKNSVSYIQIRPQIQNLKRTIPYWEYFEGHRTPLESWLLGVSELKRPVFSLATLMATQTAAQDPYFQISTQALQLAALSRQQRLRLSQDEYGFRQSTDSVQLLGERVLVARASGERVHLKVRISDLDLQVQIEPYNNKFSANSLGKDDFKELEIPYISGEFITPVSPQETKKEQNTRERQDSALLAGATVTTALVSYGLGLLGFVETESWITTFMQLTVPVTFVFGLGAVIFALRRIAETKEATQRHYQLSQQWHALLDTEGSLSVVLSPDYKILEWNREAENVFGVKRAQVLGKPFIRLFPADPKTQEKVRTRMREAIDGNRQKNIETLFQTEQRKTKHVLWNIQRILNKQGVAIGLVLSGQDITSRKEKEELLQAVAANIPGSIFQMRLSKESGIRFSYVSEGVERLVGLEAGEIVKDPRRFFSRMQRGEKEKVRDSLKQSARNMRVWDGEFSMQTEAGEIRWFRARATPLNQGDGEIVFDGVFLDVTEIKKAVEAIQRYQRELEHGKRLSSIGQMAASVVHDIRNPMQGIKTILELIERDPTQLEGYMPTLTKETKAVIELADDLLELSKPDTGTFKTFEPIDVHHSLRRAINLFRTELSNRNIWLEVGYEPMESLIYGSEQALAIVFNNLIVNAMDAMDSMEEEDGRLMVTTQLIDEGRKLQISFIDTGSGIDPSIMNKLFEPFASTKGRKGTGLGLAAAKRIIEMHQGTIEVKSRLGKGTQFIISLPLATEREDSKKLLLPKLRPEVSGRVVRRVILVDDEPSITSSQKAILSIILDIDGESISRAHDGPEALKIFKDDPEGVDLVIIDFRLPSMLGDELAKRMREINKETIIILSSAYIDEGKRRKLMQVADHVLDKPFSIEQLVEMFQRLEISNITEDALGSSLGSKQEELPEALQEYFSILMPKQELGRLLNQIPDVQAPMALVFPWQVLRSGALPEELVFLFERFPNLKIFMPTQKPYEEFRAELAQFDPEGLLNDYREWGSKKQFQVLEGLSIQEAKRRAKLEHIKVRGDVGDKSLAVFVFDENTSEIIFLGSKQMKRFSVSAETPEGDSGFIVGLPLIGVLSLQGYRNLPQNVQQIAQDFYQVYGLSLQSLSDVLRIKLLSRKGLEQAA